LAERPYPWEDVDMDVIRGRAADGHFYARCCCRDWSSASFDGRQIAGSLHRHLDRCPDALMAGIEEDNIAGWILTAEDRDNPPE
jgi:hypothetical protein